MIHVAYANPIAWWHIHESQISNVDLLVKQKFENLGS
jgi:hypothetical protein